MRPPVFSSYHAIQNAIRGWNHLTYLLDFSSGSNNLFRLGVQVGINRRCSILHIVEQLFALWKLVILIHIIFAIFLFGLHFHHEPAIVRLPLTFNFGELSLEWLQLNISTCTTLDSYSLDWPLLMEHISTEICFRSRSLALISLAYCC